MKMRVQSEESHLLMFAPATFKVGVDGGAVFRILDPVAHLKINWCQPRVMFRLATHLVRICEKQQVVEPEADNRSQGSNLFFCRLHRAREIEYILVFDIWTCEFTLASFLDLVTKDFPDISVHNNNKKNHPMHQKKHAQWDIKKWKLRNNFPPTPHLQIRNVRSIEWLRSFGTHCFFVGLVFVVPSCGCTAFSSKRSLVTHPGGGGQ